MRLVSTCISPVEFVCEPVNSETCRAFQTGVHYNLRRKEKRKTDGGKKEKDKQVDIKKNSEHSVNLRENVIMNELNN